MNEKIVMAANEYDRIDGKNAYRSSVKRLTLGAPGLEEHKSMPIAAQIWKEQADGTLAVSCELPVHQVFDLMILLSRTLLHFKEAYRLPLLYDPDDPIIERVGIQGDAMSVAVCTDNPDINGDILEFSQSLSDLGELTGERLRALARILQELECY